MAIKKLLPKEAGDININFDPQRSQVVIEAEKPGLAIGKSGELLKEIKIQTGETKVRSDCRNVRARTTGGRRVDLN